MSLMFLGTFMVTLAVQRPDWLHWRRPPPAVPARQLSAAELLHIQMTTAAPKISHDEIARNITRALGCVPSDVLSLAEIEQVKQALIDQPQNSRPSPPKAFDTASFDPQNITLQQGMEFQGMLAQIKGPVGDKARQGFNQALSDGTCRIARS
ncbi:MAG: hypothetical protein ACREIC_25475 [Limisphaerales bacterium]